MRPLAGLVITHIFRPRHVQFPGECPGFAPNRGSERLPGLPGNLADGSCSVGRVPFGHTRRGRFGKEPMSMCRVRVRPLLRPARAGLGSPTSRETDPDPDLQTKSRDVGKDRVKTLGGWLIWAGLVGVESCGGRFELGLIPPIQGGYAGG